MSTTSPKVLHLISSLWLLTGNVGCAPTLASVQRTSDEEELAEYALSAEDPEVRRAAIDKLADPRILRTTWFQMRSRRKSECPLLIRRIRDQELLCKIGGDVNEDTDLRLQAINVTENQACLVRTAFAAVAANDPFVFRAARKRIGGDGDRATFDRLKLAEAVLAFNALVGRNSAGWSPEKRSYPAFMTVAFAHRFSSVAPTAAFGSSVALSFDPLSGALTLKVAEASFETRQVLDVGALREVRITSSFNPVTVWQQANAAARMMDGYTWASWLSSEHPSMVYLVFDTAPGEDVATTLKSTWDMPRRPKEEASLTHRSSSAWIGVRSREASAAKILEGLRSWSEGFNEAVKASRVGPR